MKKTYIVKYTKVNRAGAWRDYKKEVVTDDIADYVINALDVDFLFYPLHFILIFDIL